MNAETETGHGARGGDVLTIAFGATVVMWASLYVAAMPPGHAGMWITAVAAIVATLVGAGFVAGRCTGCGLAGGAGFGALLTGISLVVLLSLMGGREAGELIQAVWWLAGLGVSAVVLCGVGAAVGARRAPSAPRINWTSRLAWVTATTVLLMLVAGGIVTGLEAGLAVEGWLKPEGHLLVLFPVTLMQRDLPTFVEHAHRLWGLLVGLTTIALLVHVWMVDRRGWLRGLAVVLVTAVVGQGVLGGTRVIEESVLLGVVHGVVAPAILAIVVTLALATSTTWLSDRPPHVQPSVRTDRTLGLVLLLAIAIQITLGTLFRHLQPQEVSRGALMGLLHGHSFVGSLFVTVLSVWCGVRAWGLYRDQGPVRRSGTVLIHTLILQVLLGVAAFMVVPKGPRDPGDPIGVGEVIVTSAHQTVGALLAVAAVALFAWQRRMLAADPC